MLNFRCLFTGDFYGTKDIFLRVKDEKKGGPYPSDYEDDWNPNDPGTNADFYFDTGYVAKGSLPLAANVAPTVESVVPDNGWGASKTFIAVYDDFNDGDRLEMVHFKLYFGSTDAWVRYDVLNKVIWLRSETEGWKTELSGPINQSKTLENDWVTFNTNGVSEYIAGSTLTMHFPMTFTSAFSGPKIISMYAYDGQGNSDWQTRGTFAVTTTNYAPTCVSVDPDAGSGTSQTFSAKFSDPNGARHLATLYLKVNYTTSGANCANIRFDAATNKLWLRENEGYNFFGGYVIGTEETPETKLENNQVYIDYEEATVDYSDTDLTLLTLQVPMIFKSGFTGFKYIYMKAVDFGQLNSGEQNVGFYNITNGNIAPEAVSVSPSSGSGPAQSFNALYRDGNGTGDLVTARFKLNTGTGATDCAYMRYDEATRQFWLRNDASTAWLGGFVVGTSHLVQNAQVRVDVSSVRDTFSGGIDLTMRWPLVFRNFLGLKNIYMYANDGAGADSGWQTMGTWTVTQSAPPDGEGYGIVLGGGESDFMPGETVTFINRDADIRGVRWFIDGRTLEGDVVDYAFERPGMYEVLMQGKYDGKIPVVHGDAVFVGERLLRAGTLAEFMRGGDRLTLGARKFDVMDLGEVADEPVIVRLRGRLDWLTRIEFAREADGDCAYIELELTRAVDTLRWRLGRVVGGTDVPVGYAEMPRPRSAESMILLRLDPSGACSMSVDGLELFGREMAVAGASGGLRLRVPFELDEMDIIVSEEVR